VLRGRVQHSCRGHTHTIHIRGVKVGVAARRSALTPIRRAPSWVPSFIGNAICACNVVVAARPVADVGLLQQGVHMGPGSAG
jgi:hypothetical protein